MLGNNNNNKNNNEKKKNPHLNFLKGTVLGDKEQGVGITDKGGIRDKGQGSMVKGQGQGSWVKGLRIRDKT